MLLSRRSLLKTLGTLPAAWQLRAFAAPVPACAATTPSPTSAFIFLQGPWLIFPALGDDTQLTALSADTSMDGSGVTHYCVLQMYYAGQFVQPVGALDAGGAVTTASSNSDPAHFFSVFDAAFQKYPFLWANTDTSAAVVSGKDRSISLPVPNVVHIAGRLVHSKVSGSGYRTPTTGQTVYPHVTTILEYTAPAGGGDIAINLTGAVNATLGPADQLAISMFHGAPIGQSDLPHMQNSFNFLKSHLSNGGKNIQVKYNDSKFDPADCNGFTNRELGLDPNGQSLIQAYAKIKKMVQFAFSGTYSNCCGGGIISGGGGGGPMVRKHG